MEGVWNVSSVSLGMKVDVSDRGGGGGSGILAQLAWA